MIAMILYLALLGQLRGDVPTQPKCAGPWGPCWTFIYPEDVPPMDVPATTTLDNAYVGVCANGQMPDILGVYCSVPRWTCADKSRVLLTSENGVRHCIRF